MIFKLEQAFPSSSCKMTNLFLLNTSTVELEIQLYTSSQHMIALGALDTCNTFFPVFIMFSI